MRAWGWVGAVALFVGCSSSGYAPLGDGGAADGARGSDAGSADVDLAPAGFGLVRMEPSQVPFRGAEVTLYFQGTPPPSITCPAGSVGQYCNLSLQVNGVQASLDCGLDPEVSPPCPPSTWKVRVPRDQANVQNQPIVIVAYAPGGGTWRLDPAGHYLPPLPGQPHLLVQSGFDTSGPDGFDLPLPPELARPCARRDWAYMSNDGDLPLDVTSVSLAGESAFTVDMDGCSGKQLPPFGALGSSGEAANECAARLCFDSATPGSHGATLTIVTAAGAVSATIAASVSAPSTGLDTSFASTGVLPLGIYTHVRQTTLPARPNMTPAALMGDGVAVDSSQGLARVHPDGTVTTWPGARSNWAIASSWDRASIYCASESVTQHYTDAGLDAAFGTSGSAPYGVSTIVGAINVGMIAAAPNGNLLIDNDAFSVVALTSAGALDSAFGPGGQIGVAAEDSIAIDGQGRLYLGLRSYTDATHFTESIERRSTVDGSLDAAFSYAASGILALDGQDHLYVASGTSLVELDGTGKPTTIPLAWPASLTDGLYDLALDEAGRWLVAHGKDRVLRFAADGTFDAQFGMADALRVLCPSTGGCWEVGIGAAASDGFVARLSP